MILSRMSFIFPCVGTLLIHFQCVFWSNRKQTIFWSHCIRNIFLLIKKGVRNFGIKKNLWRARWKGKGVKMTKQRTGWQMECHSHWLKFKNFPNFAASNRCRRFFNPQRQKCKIDRTSICRPLIWSRNLKIQKRYPSLRFYPHLKMTWAQNFVVLVLTALGCQAVLFL